MLLLFVQKYDFIYKRPVLGPIPTSNLIPHNNFFTGKHEKVGSDFVKQIVAKVGALVSCERLAHQ